MGDWKGVLGTLLVGGSQGYLAGKQQEWSEEAAGLKRQAAQSVEKNKRRWSLEDREAGFSHEKEIETLKQKGELSVEEAKQLNLNERDRLDRESKERVAEIGARGRSSGGAKSMTEDKLLKLEDEWKTKYQEYIGNFDTGAEEGYFGTSVGEKEAVNEPMDFESFVVAGSERAAKALGIEATEPEPQMVGDETITTPQGAIAALGIGDKPPVPTEVATPDVEEPAPIAVEPDGTIGQIQQESDREELVARAGAGDEGAIEELRMSEKKAQLDADVQKRSLVGKVKEFAKWSSGRASDGKPKVSGIAARNLAKKAGLPPEAAEKLAMPEFKELAYLIDAALRDGDVEELAKLVEKL